MGTWHKPIHCIGQVGWQKLVKCMLYVEDDLRMLGNLMQTVYRSDEGVDL